MNNYQYYYDTEVGSVLRVLDEVIEGWQVGVGFSIIKDMTSREIDVNYIPCTEEAQAAIQRFELKFSEGAQDVTEII